LFDVPSIRIGRVFGIPVEVNASWLVVFALVTFSLWANYYPAIAEARSAPTWVLVSISALTALAFFASVLAHELCHSLVAKAEGGHVEKITLFIFGGLAHIDEEPRTPGREFLMAAAGPAMSLLLAVACYGGQVVAVAAGASWWVWAPLEYLAAINLAVAVFNMLPGFPLDGGRVLRSILWAITGNLLKATRWASRSGQLIGWLMVGGAVAGVLRGSTNLIWLGLVGWFIASLAGQAYRQQEFRSRVEGVAVAEIMSSGPVCVEGELSLDEFIRRYLLDGGHGRYPVLLDGAVIGLVTREGVGSVARPDWPYVRVADVTDRDLGTLTVDVDGEVSEVLARLAQDKPGALLVVKAGHLVGIVTRTDVLGLIQEGTRQKG
jgi:Zn-dependent protease/predicted transcriptional regulator